MLTVYVSIGNSDDKLSQREWSNFVMDVRNAITNFAHAIHGQWFSVPDSSWQNCTFCIEIPKDGESSLKARLSKLASAYLQDSIAWAQVLDTEFIRAS